MQRPSNIVRVFALPVLLLAAALMSFAGSTGKSPNEKVDPELGKRIYREGLLPSGKHLRAIVQGDLQVEGKQISCASCHRRSGFGSSEGAALVPPVIGSFLFHGRELQRTELFRKLFQEIQPSQLRVRLRGLRARPAYTEETFAAALREGKDPLGRQLDSLMPRYDLSDEDSRHLIAYLNSIEASPEPAVSSSAIHFATVITDNAGPERRQSLLNVMNAFFRWHNAETRGLLERPGHAAFYDATSYSSLREWILDVWELRGPQATWPQQLADYYRKQPVFALLGGTGEGSWQPVHDFCERTEVPCLFPNTNLPVVTSAVDYSIYLNGGLATEAAALAIHINEGLRGSAAKILQVYRDSGIVPAETLRRSLAERVDVRQRKLRDGEKLSAVFWKRLLEEERPSLLVLWLEEPDLKTLAQVDLEGVKQIYLSTSLVEGDLTALAPLLREKLFLTFPFSLPEAPAPHAFRARAWLRSRGIAPANERIQLNTYFMLGVVDHALMNLAGNFSRDYFIENVELETGLTPNPGVFPRLSLGPGQRFASKGSYVVRVSNGKIEAVSRWIVP